MLYLFLGCLFALAVHGYSVTVGTAIANATTTNNTSGPGSLFAGPNCLLRYDSSAGYSFYYNSPCSLGCTPCSQLAFSRCKTDLIYTAPFDNSLVAAVKPQMPSDLANNIEYTAYSPSQLTSFVCPEGGSVCISWVQQMTSFHIYVDSPGGQCGMYEGPHQIWAPTGNGHFQYKVTNPNTGSSGPPPVKPPTGPTCYSGFYGSGNGQGSAGDCCQSNNDCRNVCNSGRCDGSNATPGLSCAGGSSGSGNGDGSSGACCVSSNDCIDTCTNGMCGNGDGSSNGSSSCSGGNPGAGNGNGASGACCTTSNDCLDTCTNGMCGAGGVTTISSKITSAKASATNSCSCTSGYSGKANGGGPTGACCTTNNDCADTCNNGMCGINGATCGAGGVTTTTASKATTAKASTTNSCSCTSGYSGKANGGGPTGACCITSNDCADTCNNGICGITGATCGTGGITSTTATKTTTAKNSTITSSTTVNSSTLISNATSTINSTPTPTSITGCLSLTSLGRQLQDGSAGTCCLTELDCGLEYGCIDGVCSIAYDDPEIFDDCTDCTNECPTTTTSYAYTTNYITTTTLAFDAPTPVIPVDIWPFPGPVPGPFPFCLLCFAGTLNNNGPAGVVCANDNDCASGTCNENNACDGIAVIAANVTANISTTINGTPTVITTAIPTNITTTIVNNPVSTDAFITVIPTNITTMIPTSMITIMSTTTPTIIPTKITTVVPTNITSTINGTPTVIVTNTSSTITGFTTMIPINVTKTITGITTIMPTNVTSTIAMPTLSTSVVNGTTTYFVNATTTNFYGTITVYVNATGTATSTTATTTSAAAACTCTSGYYGLGNGKGSTRACCKTNNDCVDTCNSDGACGVSGVLMSCSTATTTSAAAACTCTSGYYGAANGKGSIGACCKTSNDCVDTCNSDGACGVSGVLMSCSTATTTSAAAACTCTSGYYGLGNGKGSTGACCKTNNDCVDTCNSDGACGVSGVLLC